jgi:hypothetical protein
MVLLADLKHHHLQQGSKEPIGFGNHHNESLSHQGKQMGWIGRKKLMNNEQSVTSEESINQY